MANDSRKPEYTNPRPAKQDEKIADLPTPDQSDIDAQQIKGGARKNVVSKP